MALSISDSNSGNTPKRGGLKRVYELAKPALNLSSEQEKSIVEALNELKEERQNSNSSGEDKKEQMRTARKQVKQKIIAVLTPEQKLIWQKIIDKRREESE